MGQEDLRNLSFEELSAYLVSVNEKPFRVKQIFEWLYKRQAQGFGEMKNLPPALRQHLAADFGLFSPSVLHRDVSRDQTTKFLFTLADKEKIESVLIPTASRRSVCLSTQAGCKFGCRFCASGIGGWKRNLSCAEILDQILYIQRNCRGTPLSHVVFMGTGEPLDNYDNLIKAIRIINSVQGLNIAARRITISTCGVIPQIEQLAQEGLQIELAVSLHGFNNESRNLLMPVNRKYPLQDLIEACEVYSRKTNRQITFEYILIKGMTCSDRAAKELGQLLKGMLCKMNLIPYNKVAEFAYEPPSRQEILVFKKQLEGYGIHATVRVSRGGDVSAACGQLRHVTSDTMPKAYPR